MSSLWKKANRPQYKMLKIISGAVLNVKHAHPNQPVDKKFAQGVAKRAVGTISSHWGEIVGGKTEKLNLLSSDARLTLIESCDCQRYHGSQRHTPFSYDVGRGRIDKRSYPFSYLSKQINRSIKPLRLAGRSEDAEILISIAKMLHPLVEKEKQNVEQNTKIRDSSRT